MQEAADRSGPSATTNQGKESHRDPGSLLHLNNRSQGNAAPLSADLQGEWRRLPQSNSHSTAMSAAPGYAQYPARQQGPPISLPTYHPYRVIDEHYRQGFAPSDTQSAAALRRTNEYSNPANMEYVHPQTQYFGGMVGHPMQQSSSAGVNAFYPAVSQSTTNTANRIPSATPVASYVPMYSQNCSYAPPATEWTWVDPQNAVTFPSFPRYSGYAPGSEPLPAQLPSQPSSFPPQSLYSQAPSMNYGGSAGPSFGTAGFWSPRQRFVDAYPSSEFQDIHENALKSVRLRRQAPIPPSEVFHFQHPPSTQQTEWCVPGNPEQKLFGEFQILSEIAKEELAALESSPKRKSRESSTGATGTMAQSAPRSNTLGQDLWLTSRALATSAVAVGGMVAAGLPSTITPRSFDLQSNGHQNGNVSLADHVGVAWGATTSLGLAKNPMDTGSSSNTAPTTNESIVGELLPYTRGRNMARSAAEERKRKHTVGSVTSLTADRIEARRDSWRRSSEKYREKKAAEQRKAQARHEEAEKRVKALEVEEIALHAEVNLCKRVLAECQQSQKTLCRVDQIID